MQTNCADSSFSKVLTIYYILEGSTILGEITKSGSGTAIRTIRYIYDNANNPVGLVCNGVTHLYEKNIQGDIVSIIDSTGARVVTYPIDFEKIFMK